MARIRTIKPEFWRSPDIRELSFFQRLLYIGLWNLADDEGRGKYEPASIAADLFLTEFSLNPHGTITEVSNAFTEYSNRQMVAVYEVKNRQYFQIMNWRDHQRINRPTASKLPPLTCTDSTQIEFTESSLSPHAQLTPGTWNREGEHELINPQIPPNEPPTETHTTPPVEDKKPTTPQPDTKALEEALDLFKEFWEHYPRKQDKQKALKEFAVQIETTDPHTIIAGAEKLASDPNLPEKRWIPYAENWLHDHRWEDEPHPFQPKPWQNTNPENFFDPLAHFPSFQAENDF